MQSMTEKKKELEAACANAVKAKDYAAAAKAAADAAALTEKLEKLPSLESSYVPEDSVFREFIGN